MDTAFQASGVDMGPLLLSAAGSMLTIATFLALVVAGNARAQERPKLRWAIPAAFFVAYWLTAVLGLQWAAVSGAGSPVWPAAGVGLAGLLLGGIRLWPAILIGRLAAAITMGSGQPWWADLVIALANAGPTVLAALVLTRWFPIDLRLTAIRDVVRLASAIAAGSTLGAIIGTGVLVLAHGLGAAMAFQVGIGWTFGSIAGALLVTPAMLTWGCSAAWRMSAWQWSGLVGLLAAAAVVSNEIFFDRTFAFLRTWYVYPALIWIAVAYRVRGVALALLIVSTAAIWSATIGVGSFVAIANTQLGRLGLAQQFTTITATASLILAAAADERRGLEALHHREARENSIADTAVDPIVVIDERGIIVFCNPAAERAFGYDRAEILGQNVSLLMPEPHRTAHDGFPEKHEQSGKTGGGRQVEGRRKDGTTFPLDLSVAEWEAGGSRFFTGIMRDQTERVRADDAIRASERRLALAIEASGGAVYEKTVPSNEETYVSQQVPEMLGYESLPVPPEQFDEWVLEQIHPDDREHRQALRGAFIEGRVPRSEVEVRMRHADGRWLWVRSFAQALERDSEGRVQRLSGMFIDITERRLAQNQVAHLARHDSLTGLANRTLFAEQLAEATRLADVGSFQAALVLIDLDHFKSINDTYGHQVGDSLLQVVTARLTSSIRPGDTAARLGGDEFALVAPNVRSRDDVQELANRLRNALAEPAVVASMKIEVTVSVGFALYPEDAGTVDLLMRHADLALYEAKEKGRSRVCGFRPELEVVATHRAQVETALRRAIQNNDLMLHYQPQFEMASGRVHCVEALLRWRRDGATIAPHEFIAIAEKSSLIRTLGAWVIREACRQQAFWRAEGIDVKIAVNISVAEANAEDFAAHLDQALAEFRVPSNTLEFEITEGFLMDPTSKSVQAFLKACQERGISLAIDDFGTGYSSLSYLARLPISKIKIDRSFVSQIEHPDEALIEAVVTIGHRLNKRIVAEGVETQGEMEFLRNLACDDVQGFHLCRPADAAEIRPLLRQQSARISSGYPEEGHVALFSEGSLSV